ncbi:hypothetical protein BDV97DRAFT_341912 [Delphinella strobiligena]|nr:hypothetical protein BDV97DRAFT_341912 [Delphinella strobiligena]
MAASATPKLWDLSQVHGLINTLDAKKGVDIPLRPRQRDNRPDGLHSLPNESPLSPGGSGDRGGVSLGDFGKIWEYLGAPHDSPAPKVPDDPNNNKAALKPSPTLQERVPIKTDYTSDGAVYLTPRRTPSKSIQWRDEANGGDLTDVAPLVEQKLTKTQRKKKNRQERRRLAAEVDGISASDFESEVEVEDKQNRSTPARKASAHSVVVESPHVADRYNLRPRDNAGNAITAETGSTPVATPVKPFKSPEDFFKKRDRSRSPTKQPQRAKSQAFDTAPSTPQSAIAAGRKHSQPLMNTTPKTEVKQNDKKQWPVPTFWARILPASVKPTDYLLGPDGPKLKPLVKKRDLSMKSPNNRPIIEPKTVRTGEDRNWALLLKLVSNFYEDRKHLVNPANLSNHSNNPQGIHVFVDASNIFIGFHDALKRARGIPQYQHVPRVDMSFDSLALLMERRRPTCKRVLAGSKPNIAAFDTAREIGYECSILDKVKKARELTERQLYFKEQEQKKKYGRSKGYRSGSASGGDSGGETSTGPVYAPEAFVEQGVDELLHLKMMESLVDTKEPSTMVLATGDAAQAEYSSGFMRMAERALDKGWKVEVVSWSRNISQAYKKPDFRNKWGENFKIVELDDYAEELLDM